MPVVPLSVQYVHQLGGTATSLEAAEASAAQKKLLAHIFALHVTHLTSGEVSTRIRCCDGQQETDIMHNVKVRTPLKHQQGF